MKKVSDSQCESVYLVLSQHLNGSERLFGGVLLQWIDTLGAIVARRHCLCEVTTAAIDDLRFLKPVKLNSTVVLKGRVTYVGRTSMEVCVETYVEDMQCNRCLVNKAYLVFVAVKNGCPVEVPQLELVNDQEREEFENGKKRQLMRKQQRCNDH